MEMCVLILSIFFFRPSIPTHDLSLPEHDCPPQPKKLRATKTTEVTKRTTAKSTKSKQRVCHVQCNDRVRPPNISGEVGPGGERGCPDKKSAIVEGNARTGTDSVTKIRKMPGRRHQPHHTFGGPILVLG